MSDNELKALENAAISARANADELNAGLTESSTDEERALAAEALTAATTAETAFTEAKAKADAEAAQAAQAEAEAKAKADAEAAAQQTKDAADADASRTGYADRGLRAGDPCICPDGRKGTVHSFDAGLISIPNAEQGE
jgi:hypothetical protein